jgi:hypothetical protein
MQKGQCFWAGQDVNRDTQGDILRSIRMLSRHFAAASMSLTTTNAFDAARTLTFGCMAAIADAVLRVAAYDAPSALSLHYRCEGGMHTGAASSAGNPESSQMAPPQGPIHACACSPSQRWADAVADGMRGAVGLHRGPRTRLLSSWAATLLS